jgi:hypothetical protein
VNDQERAEAAPPFEIFRAHDATDYDETVMYPGPATDMDWQGAAALVEAGLNEGSRVKLLYSRPGMSLTYCWFKSGFPLPLHSHDCECLYFVITGSLRMGTEEFGTGDGFFVGTCPIPMCRARMVSNCSNSAPRTVSTARRSARPGPIGRRR